MDNIIDVLNIATVAICTSVFAVVWIRILTTPQAIFKAAPLYYGDNLLRKIMSCEKCLSGWLSMLIIFAIEFMVLLGGGDWLFYWEQSIRIILHTILGGVFGIYIALLISRNMNK